MDLNDDDEVYVVTYQCPDCEDHHPIISTYYGGREFADKMAEALSAAFDQGLRVWHADEYEAQFGSVN